MNTAAPILILILILYLEVGLNEKNAAQVHKFHAYRYKINRGEKKTREKKKEKEE